LLTRPIWAELCGGMGKAAVVTVTVKDKLTITLTQHYGMTQRHTLS